MEKTKSFLVQVIFDIENSKWNAIKERPEAETYELSADASLRANLSGGIGTYLVRAMLHKLGVNEHQVFKWRLENKYMQYQVFHHYIPRAVAKTYSLSELLDEDDGVIKIKRLCENGFFIKSALGDNSGRNNQFDRTADLDEIIDSHQAAYNDQEKWIIQEKLDLNEEFRIHTFGKELIPGLSFRINGSSSDGIEAQEFVKLILEKLPDGILHGTLIGWDIGITDTDQFFVIEANFTGFYPAYNRGFQTSIYFQDGIYGAIVCACLNNYFKQRYKISIGSIENNLLANYQFYLDFLFYSSVFTPEHAAILMNKTKIGNQPALLYLGENANTLYVTLVRYFQLINLAPIFYLIVDEGSAPTFIELLAGNEFIQVMVMQTMVTEDQYLLTDGLTYEESKKMYCDQAIRMIGKKTVIIL